MLRRFCCSQLRTSVAAAATAVTAVTSAAGGINASSHVIGCCCSYFRSSTSSSMRHCSSSSSSSSSSRGPAAASHPVSGSSSIPGLAGATTTTASSPTGTAEGGGGPAPATEAARALVTVKDTNMAGVHILELNSPKANVLTSELITGILSHIRELCDPDKGRARGLIITSGVPGIFSGGLDINALYNNVTELPRESAGGEKNMTGGGGGEVKEVDREEEARFAYYWNNFQQLFSTLHSLPIPVLAAINGHAAAAGCIVALACDYRVMARQRGVSNNSNTNSNNNNSAAAKPSRPLTIGISASNYGIVVPPYVAASLVHVVGFREAEMLLTQGTMLTADAARAVGLVDEVTEYADEAVVPCMLEMERLLSASPSPLPYWMVKDRCRRDVLAPLASHALRAADTGNFYRMLRDPTVRKTLRAHINSLGSKGRGKEEKKGSE